MATEEDETPRAMIGQFIERHQSSKSTRIAPGRGLRNRPRSSSLGVDADKGSVVEVHRVGQRPATKARLSTSEFTPHNTIEQFLKVSKTTEPTRREREALSHTPADSQAAGKSLLSSQRSGGAVSRLRSAAVQSHKPTPRSVISAFIQQGVEETPVAAPITNNSSTFDETIPGSEAAPKRRKSIREESFLQHLEVENEDALPKRSRFVPTRPRLSAFEMASKFNAEASKKGSRNALSVTVEMHNPPRTQGEDVADDSPSSSLLENRTDALEEIQENDEHEVPFPDVDEVRQLSRRSTRVEAMSVSPQALATTPSPRPSPSNTSTTSDTSPSHSMRLRQQGSSLSQRTLMAPPSPRNSVSRTSNTPVKSSSESRSVELRQQRSSMSRRTLMAPASPRDSVSRTSNTPVRTPSQSSSMELRRERSSLSPRSPGKLVTPMSQRASTSRTSNTPMRSSSESRSADLRQQTSSLSVRSPRTIGKSQNVSKSSASRNISLSVRRTSSAANATLEKTSTSVTRRSASATVASSFVAPADSDGEGERGESSQEDIGRVTEGIGSEERDEAENTAEKINYNERLLSFFQEATEPGDVSGDAETAAVNGAEHDDRTHGDGSVADGDSWHGDDPVNGERSPGDVSEGDRLTAAVRRNETPNIFEAARERRNVKITPSRSVSARHGSNVKKVIETESRLWEKRMTSNASRRNIATTAPVLQQSQNATAPPRKRKASDPSRPRLPASLTRSIFSHFSRSRVSKTTMDEVEKVADVYWKNVVSDLDAYVKHADRGTLMETDIEMLLKRQRFVTDKTTMYTLVEKHLALEYRQEIIPMARTGNKVVPKH